MPKYSVSKAARSDLRAIVRYTFEKWGQNQAIKYVGDLQASFEILSSDPGLGRACNAIRVGLQRHEHGKHVVYYRMKPGGIRIVRVLHQQMIPAKSHFE